MSVIEVLYKPYFFFYGLVCILLSAECVLYKTYWPLIVLIPCAFWGFLSSECFEPRDNQEVRSEKK